MPTSVLLAVLAAAGLLALAPALVRRYDATERQVAERAQSTARVLSRTRRRRSVPGRRPVNPPRILPPTLRAAAPVPPHSSSASSASLSSSSAAASSASPSGAFPAASSSGDHEFPRRRPRRARPQAYDRQRVLSVVPRSVPPARRLRRPRYSPAIYRRRRVLAALVLLNLVELVGAVVVGPGFWAGFAVTGTLLVMFVVYLRTLALADQRRHRAEMRRAAMVATQQAEVRQEQARRAVARREAARRMAEQREALRRAAETSPTVSYRRAGGRRGRLR